MSTRQEKHVKRPYAVKIEVDFKQRHVPVVDGMALLLCFLVAEGRPGVRLDVLGQDGTI